MNDEIIETLAAARPRNSARARPSIRPRGNATRRRLLSSSPLKPHRRRRRSRRHRPDRLQLTVPRRPLGRALDCPGRGRRLAGPLVVARTETAQANHLEAPGQEASPSSIHNLLSAPVGKATAGRPRAGRHAGLLRDRDHNGPAIEVRSTTTGELLSERHACQQASTRSYARSPKAPTAASCSRSSPSPGPRSTCSRSPTGVCSAQLSQLPVQSLKIGRTCSARIEFEMAPSSRSASRSPISKAPASTGRSRS